MSCSTALRYSCGGVGAGADGDGFAAVVGRAGFGVSAGLAAGLGAERAPDSISFSTRAMRSDSAASSSGRSGWQARTAASSSATRG